MRKLSLAALFCVSLVAPAGALAQDYSWNDVVFSVEGWPKSTRVDGKLTAYWFSFLTQAPQASANAKVRNFELSLPLGEPAALFTRDSLEGRTLNTLLVEALPHGTAKPPSRAPFAVRISNVLVKSVQLNMNGTALVTLEATKIEVFTASQSATGAIQPGQQFGFDIVSGKRF